MMKVNIRQFYTTFVLTIQKRSTFELALPLPSRIFVATPLNKKKKSSFFLRQSSRYR